MVFEQYFHRRNQEAVSDDCWGTRVSRNVIRSQNVEQRPPRPLLFWSRWREEIVTNINIIYERTLIYRSNWGCAQGDAIEIVSPNKTTILDPNHSCGRKKSRPKEPEWCLLLPRSRILDFQIYVVWNFCISTESIMLSLSPPKVWEVVSREMTAGPSSVVVWRWNTRTFWRDFTTIFVLSSCAEYNAALFSGYTEITS